MYIDATESDEVRLGTPGEVGEAETMEDKFLRENGIDPHMLTPMQRGQILLAIQDGQLHEGGNVGNLGVAIARDPNALNKAIDPAVAEANRIVEEEKARREQEQQMAEAKQNMQQTVAAMATGMGAFILAVDDVPHNELFSPSQGMNPMHQQRAQGAALAI